MRLFYKTKIMLIIILGLFYGQAFAMPSAEELTKMYRDATQIPSKQAERNKLFFSVSTHLTYMNDKQVESIFNDIANTKKLKNKDGDEIISPNVVSVINTLLSVPSVKLTLVKK